MSTTNTEDSMRWGDPNAGPPDAGTLHAAVARAMRAEFTEGADTPFVAELVDALAAVAIRVCLADRDAMADEIVPLALTVLARWRDSLPDAPERMLAEACERWLAGERHYGR